MGITRERLILPLLLIALAIGALLVAVRREEAIARERVDYEDKALAALRAVAEGERRMHAREGRYGWIEDLAKAGVLAGLEQGEREGHPVVVTPRYRIDVLLPYGEAPGGIVMIAPRPDGHEVGPLARRHFAAVARPWGEERTGFRTFYLDEKAEVYVSEGVSNVASRARRSLPPAMIALRRGFPGQVAGLRWWHLEALPPR